MCLWQQAIRCMLSCCTRRLFAGALLASGISAFQDAKPPAWKSMFDGKSLAGWKETPFTAHGKVSIEDGAIVLGSGFLTGVTWTDAFPKSNYEVRLEAM